MSDQRPDRPTDPLAAPDDAPRTGGDEAVTATDLASADLTEAATAAPDPVEPEPTTDPGSTDPVDDTPVDPADLEEPVDEAHDRAVREPVEDAPDVDGPGAVEHPDERADDLLVVGSGPVDAGLPVTADAGHRTPTAPPDDSDDVAFDGADDVAFDRAEDAAAEPAWTSGLDDRAPVWSDEPDDDPAAEPAHGRPEDDAVVRPLDAPLSTVLGEDAHHVAALGLPLDATSRTDDAVPADLPDQDDTVAPGSAWAPAGASAPVPGDDTDDVEPDAHVDDVAATPQADTPVDPAPAAATPAAASESGWSVLGRALRPRVNRAQVLAGVLCALLGFALAVQIRQTSDLSLSGMRQADLVRILDEATTRGDALERERADLVAERDELLSGSDTRQAALDALRRSAETQGILAGRLPAEGRGVVVTVSDGGAQVKPVTMLNMLEELRNAGAEAMQLNDLRITASSAFTGVAGAIQLDGTTLTAPYVWKAIGDPDTIATALQMPGGAFAEVRNNGGNASVEQQDLVEVDAIRVVPDPVHATPVPPAGG